MIVKCENCQTRFKIPDEKVTEKGVKVRCTKCQHTFRVHRPPAEAAAAVPKRDQDPFAQFAPPPGAVPGGTPVTGTPISAGTPLGRGTPLSAGTPLGRGTPLKRPSAPDDLSALFSEPTRVASIPIPAEARPPPAPVLKAGADLSDAFAAPAPGRKAAAGAAPAPRPASSHLVDDVPPPPARNVPARKAPDLDFGAPPDDLGGLETTGNGAREDLFGSGQTFLTTTSKQPASGGSDRGLFDIPEAPAPSRAPAVDPFAAPAPPPVELAGPAPVIVTRTIPAPRPLGRAQDALAPDDAPRARGAARRLSALVVNLTVSAVLLAVVLALGAVYLNEGKLDLRSLSVERVRELLFPPKTVVTRDVSNGLYETRQGRAVFFVRGEVENRSATAVRARIRAEILDGDQLVRAAEGWAGEIPTPEELYAIGSADDVEALTQRLSRAARSVATGARAPFVVAFYEYPPDLSKYRLRVTVLEDGAQTAKK